MLVGVTLVDVEVVSTAVVVGAAVVVGSGATVVVGSGTTTVVDVDDVGEGTTTVVSVEVEVHAGLGYSFRLAAPATGAVVAATEVVDTGTEVAAAPGVSVTVTVTTVTLISVTKTRLLSGLAAAPKTHKAPTNNEPFILYIPDDWNFWLFLEILRRQINCE